MKGGVAALLTVFCIGGFAQPPQQLSPEAMKASTQRSESLFTGKTGFRNRGPACIACHSIAGLPFPNGGALAPDLTEVYKKIGPRGMRAAMQTLFFPVMTPIYSEHPLYPEEQADLVVFIEQAQKRPHTQSRTEVILLIALALAAIFVALTGFFGRHRVRSVRRALIHRAQGARH